MAKAISHKHKLKKHKYQNGTAIFFCILSDCHYKVEAALSIGKEVLCNQCNEPFIMNEYTIKLKRPHCVNCGKIAIKTSNGETIYVNKRGSKILSEVAANDVNSLRDRLDNLVKDEDI